MKKKSIILAVLCVVLVIFYIKLTDRKNVNILNELEGEIYYLMKDDDHISKLYKSDANLKNKTLIYSHKGKGMTSSGGSNDNIIDFRYYTESKKIEFEAMHNGEWSIFELSMDGSEPKYLRKAKEIKIDDKYRVFNVDVDYINLVSENFYIHEKNDSIFINIEGKDKCILKYSGFVRSDISGATGYTPQGLSPDGKFLVYGTTGSTGFGFLLGEYKRFIINLDTKEYTEYINSQSIQWVIEK
ncbi:hypothetical protein [Alkaliphilus peptidifermentans]|uniref:WD40-like Beta Propeller Repeat n=1 Tax=Alkaliphilus peptidifermentans DSM 18978 TaxID=1120976 RepID=A0A1G5LFJ9_9FIRM|nr:hypothetical protein [Alkaliphilus peptidifermentans]SCZ11020.1 hypothetical protein SAMN03080606_04331 [Alkaliphilus peptidifermentans DSM 18978]